MTKIDLFKFLAPFDDEVEIKIGTGTDYGVRHRNIARLEYVPMTLTSYAYIVLAVDVDND